MLDLEELYLLMMLKSLLRRYAPIPSSPLNQSPKKNLCITLNITVKLSLRYLKAMQALPGRTAWSLNLRDLKVQVSIHTP